MITNVLIETPRLILRTVTLEDVADVALSWNLDGDPITYQEAENQIMWMHENHKQIAPGKIFHLCLAIIDKATHQFIGWCGLDHRDPAKPFPVLFYLLKERYWGKGLATEATGALLDYAFRDLCLSRINSACAFENTASKRVMEKIGMRYSGLDEAGGHSFTYTQGEYFQGKKKSL